MQCNMLGSNRFFRKKYDNDVGERDSPLQVQLIKFLGLKNYFMNNFIFRRKPSKYQLIKHNNKNSIVCPKIYRPSSKLTAQVQLLQSGTYSIPILLLKHVKPISNLTIIYSHGNSSDLSESIVFLQNLALTYGVDVLGYDYSGYGQSRVAVIGEETIIRDLQLVISWLKVPLSCIILWGFSLGSFPTVCNAAKFKVGGMVLQCPIASNQALKLGSKRITFPIYKKQIRQNVGLLLYTLWKMRLLFQKFSQTNGKDKIWFLEVAQAKHNGLHKFFISKQQNDLKDEFTSFIRRVQNEVSKYRGKQQQPLLRIHNRYMIMEVQIQGQQQFCEQQYQLLAVCQTSDGLNPGRKFKERRTIIPRCFD